MYGGNYGGSYGGGAGLSVGGSVLGIPVIYILIGVAIFYVMRKKA
jgi:hypothetical protein